MDRVPILKIGEILLVSIQGDLDDHAVLTLQEDLALYPAVRLEGVDQSLVPVPPSEQRVHHRPGRRHGGLQGAEA